jgi:Protein of unknown function (DUF2802)
MSIWLILLTFFNIILLAGLSFSLFLRVKEKKEDQRLTRGLQLLQSKISILEDLSDKTDEQVRKLIHTLDQKAVEVRQTLMNTEEQAQRIDSMIHKGLEAAQNLNEQIPHQEMQNRQKTNLYVKAARLAHQGMSIDEILDEVDLTPAEIQMIIKVNKEKLQFSEQQLPTWIQQQDTSGKSSQMLQQADLNAFTEALNAQNFQFTNIPQTFTESIAPKALHAVQIAESNTLEKNIKPFEFRRITKP